MTTLTVRNLPEEMLVTLRIRAAQHGQSMEAEVLEILETALNLREHVKLGSLLADIGQQTQLSDEELAVLEQTRDKRARHPNWE